MTKVNRKYIFLIFIFLIGCGETQKVEKNVYKHSMSGSPKTFEPMLASNKYTSMVVQSVYDTLYGYKYLAQPYELRPILAAAMPTISEDGLEYDIEIKKGVFWQEHEAFENRTREVVAADVAYSLKRHFDKNNISQGKWLWSDYIEGLKQWGENGSDYDQNTSGIEPTGKYSLKIRLIKPYPQLIHSLSTSFSAIIPREVEEFYGEKFGSNPLGSGPYTFESFDGQTVKLRKNPKFRQEAVDIYYEGYDEEIHSKYDIDRIHGLSPPFVDEVEIHFIDEATSKWYSFTKDAEIQYTTVPTSLSNQVINVGDKPTVKTEYGEKYYSRFGTELGFAYFAFNMNDERFGYRDDPVLDRKNKLLRCAIRKAHNWEARNKAFYFGIGNVFPGVIPPGLYDYDPNMSKDSIQYDIQEAKEMLIQGGWNEQNLPEFEYHSVGSVQNNLIFEQTRGFLSKIGYPAEKIKSVTYPSFGTYNKAVIDGKAPFFFMGWGMDYPDAQNIIQLFYGPHKSPGSNKYNYSNPKFDALYEKTSSMMESEERKKMYSEMNQMIVDDCVAVSAINRTFLSLWHKDVIFYHTEDMTGSGFLKYVGLKDFIPQ